MFRQLARTSGVPGGIPGRAELLFRLHPVELAALLEQAWEFRMYDTNQDLGHPDRRSDIPGLPGYLLRAFPNYTQNRQRFTRQPPDGECPPGCVRWQHLIYAYMIENTRVDDIFLRVLHAFRHDEDLGVPGSGSEHWLRNTEELFYREPPPFFIHSLTSAVRPDLEATRRNAYYRMFGMDLNHGTESNQPYPYIKAKAANIDFVSTFEEFLREVWIGIINVTNTSGPRSTDEAKIADLAERLFDMLRTRRIAGNLGREEFFFVSMMEWFHLTLDFNSSIVLSLRAEGTSPEQRLFKIAERVKLPAHGKSKSFFDIADSISLILTQIETGIYNTSGGVPALFIPPTQDHIRTVITHWSFATGRDLKSTRTAPT
jgi:hypothetical protein